VYFYHVCILVVYNIFAFWLFFLSIVMSDVRVFFSEVFWVCLDCCLGVLGVFLKWFFGVLGVF
jgi:hypothetical protein